jgi:hypothetical protein
MIRFAFGNLCSLFEFQTAFFPVASTPPPHCIRMRGKRGPRFVDGAREGTQCLAVRVMRCPLCGLFPQLCHRLIIRRRGRARLHWKAMARGRQKRLGRGPGVRPSPSMDAKTVLRGWRHAPLEEPWVTVRMQPPRAALPEEAPRQRRHGPQALGALALAPGGHRRRTAPSGPGGAQRAPRRTARLLFQQAQTMTTRGGPAQGRPWLRAARPGAGPWREAPTHHGLWATTSPGGAAAYRPTGAWRAPPRPARAAPGGAPHANRPSHRRPRAHRPPATRPSVAALGQATARGALPHGARPG